MDILKVILSILCTSHVHHQKFKIPTSLAHTFSNYQTIPESQSKKLKKKTQCDLATAQEKLAPRVHDNSRTSLF